MVRRSRKSRSSRTLAVIAVVAAGLLASITPARAIELVNCTAPVAGGSWMTRPMDFRVHYAGGQKVLIAEGAYASGSTAALHSALQQHMPVAEIWFNSPGGVAQEGVLMGKLIREWGVPTRVPSGYWCISACNFAFLGGPLRAIDAGGQYAVHMFTRPGSVGRVANRMRAQGANERALEKSIESEVAATEQRSAQLATEQNDFIIRMGVSRRLLSEVMYNQEARGIRCLTPTEMTTYNVVNF